MALAIPIAIQKNVYIRSIKNGRAVLKNNSQGFYLLKAGSVIDLPDRFVIKNAKGEIDITKSLNKWMNQDRNAAGTYPIEDANHKIVGRDQFFRLIVLQAAPGSNIPTDESFIALNFLNRTRAIKPIETVVQNLPENAPIPESRPEQKTQQTDSKEARQPIDSEDLFSSNQYGRPSLSDMSGSGSGTQNLGGGGSGTGKATPAKVTHSDVGSQIPGDGNTPVVTPTDKPSKQEVLNATSDSASGGGGPPITYYEGSKIDRKDLVLPDQVPTPSLKPEEKAAVIANDTTEEIEDVGSPDKLCPKGDCGVYDSGKDNDTELFCKQIGDGGFPENLNKLNNGSSGKKVLRASLKWNTFAMKDPKTCNTLCKFESSGLARLLDVRQRNHESYCGKIEKCFSTCNTSDLIPKTKCTKDIKEKNKYCTNHCSPYLSLSPTKRNIHLKSIFSDVSGDLEQFNPDFANRMKSNGFFTSMPSRLLCLNRRRENRELDPLARNCASTAIGIGQVLKGTFYYTLGLANRIQQKQCLNIPIKDLASKCKGWDRNAFRKEAYWKYMDFTPKELYDLRTIDAELQARSSYAVILDKLRIASFNLNKAYKGYFGKSDKKAINRIETCVRTGK